MRDKRLAESLESKSHSQWQLTILVKNLNMFLAHRIAVVIF